MIVPIKANIQTSLGTIKEKADELHQVAAWANKWETPEGRKQIQEEIKLLSADLEAQVNAGINETSKYLDIVATEHHAEQATKSFLEVLNLMNEYKNQTNDESHYNDLQKALLKVKLESKKKICQKLERLLDLLFIHPNVAAKMGLPPDQTKTAAREIKSHYDKFCEEVKLLGSDSDESATSVDTLSTWRPKGITRKDRARRLSQASNKHQSSAQEAPSRHSILNSPQHGSQRSSSRSRSPEPKHEDPSPDRSWGDKDQSSHSWGGDQSSHS